MYIVGFPNPLFCLHVDVLKHFPDNTTMQTQPGNEHKQDEQKGEPLKDWPGPAGEIVKEGWVSYRYAEYEKDKEIKEQKRKENARKRKLESEKQQEMDTSPDAELKTRNSTRAKSASERRRMTTKKTTARKR